MIPSTTISQMMNIFSSSSFSFYDLHQTIPIGNHHVTYHVTFDFSTWIYGYTLHRNRRCIFALAVDSGASHLPFAYLDRLRMFQNFVPFDPFLKKWLFACDLEAMNFDTRQCVLTYVAVIRNKLSVAVAYASVLVQTAVEPLAEQLIDHMIDPFAL